MQVRTIHLDCGELGRWITDIEQVYIVDLHLGDVVWNDRQKYHGIVREVRGDGMFTVHWYKWDPRIEMPMLDYVFSPGQVWRVSSPCTEMDLKPFEKGGPYN